MAAVASPVVHPDEGFPLGEKVAIRRAFGDAFVHAAETDENLFAVTADLGGSVNLGPFAHLHPSRYVNCGVAEADMISLCAGLAIAGHNPFAVTFGSFLGRAVDHVRQSVCHNRVKVNIVGSHGGISNAQDGPSAHAIEDLAMMRALPGITVVVISDPNQLFQAVPAVAAIEGPTYLRLYREPLPVTLPPSESFEIGKARLVRAGSDVTVAVCGPHTRLCAEVADALASEVSVEVIEFHTVRPFDTEALVRSVSKTGRVVSVEDHSVWGGLGSAVAEQLTEHFPARQSRVGLREFASTGRYEELIEHAGIGPTAIREAIVKLARQ